MSNLTKAATPNGRELATPQDVADYLSLSRTSVYLLMKSGEIPFSKIGGTRRIRWSDLDAYLDSTRSGGATA